MPGSPVPLRVGVIGMASSSPPFRNKLGQHPILILWNSNSGKLKVAWTSHEYDKVNDRYVPITAKNLVSAYVSGSVITSEDSVALFYCGSQFMVMDATVNADDALVFTPDDPLKPVVVVTVSSRIYIGDEPDWTIFKQKCYVAAGF
jgi:hypothetical protein